MQVAEQLRQSVLALYDKHLAADGKAVDYEGLSADPDFHLFVNATAELQKVDMSPFSREERLAFWINIYNILVVSCARLSCATVQMRASAFSDAVLPDWLLVARQGSHEADTTCPGSEFMGSCKAWSHADNVLRITCCNYQVAALQWCLSASPSVPLLRSSVTAQDACVRACRCMRWWCSGRPPTSLRASGGFPA